MDPCTGASIAAAARSVARQDFHLYDVKLTSGSLTQSGDLTYAIAYVNDESGGDNVTLRTTLSLDATGQATCKLTDVDG